MKPSGISYNQELLNSNRNFIILQLRDHAAEQHCISVQRLQQVHKSTSTSTSTAADTCNATPMTHLDHAGAITQGEEGEAGVRAAERNPAAEPHPSPRVIGAKLPAQRVPLRPLQRLQPLRPGIGRGRRLLRRRGRRHGG